MFATWGVRTAARLALVVLAAHASGCGGPSCRSIAAAHAALPAPRPHVSTPHIRIALSYQTANALIADALPSLPTVPVEIPPALRLVVGKLDIAATAVRIRPIGHTRVVATIELALRHRGAVLLPIAVDAELLPTIAHQADGAWLAVGFGADNVTSVRPRLPANAAALLGDALYALVPEVARPRLPKLVVTAAANALLTGIADRSYQMLRTTLLARIGEVTALRMPLGHVPVERVHLRSLLDKEPTLAIELHTSLPVRRGLGPTARPRQPDAASIRIAGSAAAELGNWAIAHGHAPDRFNRKLEPTPDGPYQIALDWIPYAHRPLEVHVFREQGQCAYVRVAANPVMALTDNGLAVTVTDRRNETVRGSRLTRLFLWARKLVGYAVKWRRIASSAAVRIGPRQVEATLLGARIDGDEIAIEARISLGPANAVESAAHEAHRRGRRAARSSHPTPAPLRRRQGQDSPGRLVRAAHARR